MQLFFCNNGLKWATTLDRAFLVFTYVSYRVDMSKGLKIAIRHQIFLTELIKLLISSVDKLSEMSGSKKKVKFIKLRFIKQFYK